MVFFLSLIKVQSFVRMICAKRLVRKLREKRTRQENKKQRAMEKNFSHKASQKKLQSNKKIENYIETLLQKEVGPSVTESQRIRRSEKSSMSQTPLFTKNGS